MKNLTARVLQYEGHEDIALHLPDGGDWVRYLVAHFNEVTPDEVQPTELQGETWWPVRVSKYHRLMKWLVKEYAFIDQWQDNTSNHGCTTSCTMASGYVCKCKCNGELHSTYHRGTDWKTVLDIEQISPDVRRVHMFFDNARRG